MAKLAEKLTPLFYPTPQAANELSLGIPGSGPGKLKTEVNSFLFPIRYKRDIASLVSFFLSLLQLPEFDLNLEGVQDGERIIKSK